MSVLRKFGVEIECFTRGGHSRQSVAAAIMNLGYAAHSAMYTGQDYNVWQIKPDGSLTAPGFCLEVVAPTLVPTDANIDQVRKVANWLLANGFDVNKSMGLHIHVDASDMSPSEAAAVALRYHHRQAEIDAILAPSRRGAFYADRLYGSSLDKVERAANGRRAIWTHAERRVSVNLEHMHKGASARRIEFRQHHGTVDADKILGWHRFLCEFVAETLRLIRGNGSAPSVVDTPSSAQPIVRTQRRRRGQTRSVVVGTTGVARVLRIDAGTDYDLFLQAIEGNGVVTLQDGRGFGWPETRLRVTAHWLRRHGAALVTTYRNGELAYVGANGATTRAAIFSQPAQIRQRVSVSASAAPVLVASPAIPTATLAMVAAAPLLQNMSDQTKAWYESRRAAIATADARRRARMTP